MLSLLYNLPFVSDLGYSSVMELLELSQIMTFVKGSTVLKKEDRKAGAYLVMVWEGEIIEAHTNDQDAREPVVFHAGDWTGPLTFQPNRDQSSEASSAHKRKIVANSPGGVKIIKISVSELKFVLQTGSKLYGQFLNVRQLQKSLPAIDHFESVISENSNLSCLNPIQHRHLESLSCTRTAFDPGEFIWRRGDVADAMFIVVRGSAEFLPYRGIGSLEKGRSGSLDTPRCSVTMRDALNEAQKSAVAHSNNYNDNSDGDVDAATQPNVKQITRRATIALPTPSAPKDEFLSRSFGSTNDLESAALDEKRHMLLETSGSDLTSCDMRHKVGRSAFLGNVSEFMLAEEEPNLENACQGRHKSTLRAGAEGCDVIVFSKEDFLQFVNTHSGVLLSLLGTEVVV